MTKTLAETTNDVAEYIRANGTESAGLVADRIAAELLRDAEPYNGRVRIEIPARYTASGNPIPATFEAYEV